MSSSSSRFILMLLQRLGRDTTAIIRKIILRFIGVCVANRPSVLCKAIEDLVISAVERRLNYNFLPQKVEHCPIIEQIPVESELHAETEYDATSDSEESDDDEHRSPFLSRSGLLIPECELEKTQEGFEEPSASTEEVIQTEENSDEVTVLCYVPMAVAPPVAPAFPEHLRPTKESGCPVPPPFPFLAQINGLAKGSSVPPPPPAPFLTQLKAKISPVIVTAKNPFGDLPSPSAKLRPVYFKGLSELECQGTIRSKMNHTEALPVILEQTKSLDKDFILVEKQKKSPLDEGKHSEGLNKIDHKLALAVNLQLRISGLSAAQLLETIFVSKSAPEELISLCLKLAVLSDDYISNLSPNEEAHAFLIALASHQGWREALAALKQAQLVKSCEEANSLLQEAVRTIEASSCLRQILCSLLGMASYVNGGNQRALAHGASFEGIQSLLPLLKYLPKTSLADIDLALLKDASAISVSDLRKDLETYGMNSSVLAGIDSEMARLRQYFGCATEENPSFSDFYELIVKLNTA